MMMFMLMVMSAAKKQQARRYVELYGDLDGFYGYRDPYARRYRHGMDPLRAELFWNEFESGRFGRGRPFRGGGGFQQLQYEDDDGLDEARETIRGIDVGTLLQLQLLSIMARGRQEDEEDGEEGEEARGEYDERVLRGARALNCRAPEPLKITGEFGLSCTDPGVSRSPSLIRLLV